MNDKVIYEGVSFHRQSRKFKSSFTHKGVRYDCGVSDDPREAARLRDITIIRLGATKKLQILKRKEE